MAKDIITQQDGEGGWEVADEVDIDDAIGMMFGEDPDEEEDTETDDGETQA